MAKKVPRLFPPAKAMMFTKPSVAESFRITVMRRKLAMVINPESTVAR